MTTSRNNNTQPNEDGEDQDDAKEEEDNGVYIPGLLAKLNAHDLRRRIDKETEFDKRFESLKIHFTSSHYFLFRFSSDLVKMKRGATEALRQHREDIQAGTEQMPEDPKLYWNRMRPICTTRLADVAADLLTVPASSVPSERLFSVAGVMCTGEQSIHYEY